MHDYIRYISNLGQRFSIWEVKGFDYPIIFMTKRRIMIVTYEAHVSDPFRNIGNDGPLEADCFCENTLETKEGGNYQLSPPLLKNAHFEFQATSKLQFSKTQQCIFLFRRLST